MATLFTTLPTGARSLRQKFGNFYTANFGNLSVSKVDSGGYVTTYTLVSEPLTLDVDSTGNILVACADGNIYLIDVLGTISTFVTGTGTTNPYDLRVNNSNQVLLLTSIDNFAKLYTQTGLLISTSAVNGQKATSDAYGNFYFASGGTLYKINTAGVLTVEASVPGYSSISIEFDHEFNLYIVDVNQTDVIKVDPLTTVTTYVTVGANLYNIAFTNDNTLLAVSESPTNTVSQYPVGGPLSTLDTFTTGTSPLCVMGSDDNLYVLNNGSLYVVLFPAPSPLAATIAVNTATAIIGGQVTYTVTATGTGPIKVVWSDGTSGLTNKKIYSSLGAQSTLTATVTDGESVTVLTTPVVTVVDPIKIPLIEIASKQDWDRIRVFPYNY